MFISGLVAFLVGVGVLVGVALLITIIDIIWMVSCKVSGKPWPVAPRSDGLNQSFSLGLSSRVAE